ncbi:MAG TPA: hypothetical protein VGH65_05230 [Verrucomicrobiaceae bacterium]|jgi:hypothetical protein
MKTPRICLLTALLLCGCAGIDSDAPNLNKEDVQEAFERGTLLCGMTPRQVRYAWGEPRERRTTAGGEQWIYLPDVPATGVGYDPVVTVTFVQGKVESVLNGDLKRKRAQMVPSDDLARRASRWNGNGTSMPSLRGS